MLMVAFLEYAMHRWLLHWWGTVAGRAHLSHHKTFTKSFVGEEELVFFDRTWVRLIVMFVAYSLCLSPLLLISASWCPWLFAYLVAIGTVHAGVWNKYHNEMHRPTGAWWAQTRHFRHVRDFHLVHHHYPRTNYGFLAAPIFDVVFGTRRREV